MEYIVVQAGGKGSRLKHLTKNKPKALVPVENLPMLFHLFRKYSKKRFVIIADYHREVMREYLAAFAEVNYQVVDALGDGSCAGIGSALKLIPENEPFMLIWSDLILPEEFLLPEGYQDGERPKHDYVGISQTFPCRWSYQGETFYEKRSIAHGVAGLFLFTGKEKLRDVPDSGELVQWMRDKGKRFLEVGLSNTREFGILEEYEKLTRDKCRPFNRITICGDHFVKVPVDAQGITLAKREQAWYQEVRSLMSSEEDGLFPKIYSFDPLDMEYIHGRNIYECKLNRQEKEKTLQLLVSFLKRLHALGSVPADTFSLKEAYYTKTVKRLAKVEDLIPFAREKEITINGKRCRNVYYHKQELEKKLQQLHCDQFVLIHGDCTFSNWILREDGRPALIDPRGYFGFTEFYGDARYDWAKLYYSIAGNYDRFNLKEFHLEITDQEVCLEIASNHWEDMEDMFFALTGADRSEIQLLHAVIWLSLTTYAWQDYDSICGAFYNGLYYLEDVL